MVSLRRLSRLGALCGFATSSTLVLFAGRIDVPCLVSRISEPACLFTGPEPSGRDPEGRKAGARKVGVEEVLDCDVEVVALFCNAPLFGAGT